MSAASADEEKLQRLAQFHERNQQFLKQAQNNNTTMPVDNNNSEISRLNDKITELQLQVQQLTHELETTRDAYQLSSDKSRAEIAMLQSQIEHTNARHEQITDSLRSRLVESELARIKMQDQLVVSFDTKTKDEEERKNLWMQMTSTVAEEKKWVDEQMDHWKESMESRRSSLHDAKMRGTIDAAGMVGDSVGAEEVGTGKRSAAGRRSRQRQLWGNADYNDSKDNDDDDDGIESERIFGGK
jgi:hypothetical protein